MFLVFVFDGLRPDLVTPAVMPRLSALRTAGTWFEQSHCVFPSVTRVNASSLATGSFPRTHGIPANTLYLPQLYAGKPLQTTGDAAVLRHVQAHTGARLLGVPTLAEVLAASGMATVTVGTGSPGSTYLLDPECESGARGMFHYAFSLPEHLPRQIAERLGPHPPSGVGYTVEALTARVRYAADALAEVLVPAVQPALAYFWCTVPDGLHHRFGLGSPEATRGMQVVDAIFGSLLDRLEQATGEAPNVIVTADHGYYTVDRIVDVPARVAAIADGLGRAAVVAVDGGAVHLYFDGAEPPAGFVDRLLAEDWVGAVLSRRPAAGALPLSAAALDTEHAADLVACFAWRPDDNGRGVAGLAHGGGGIASGAGDHGGGSPFEMRNTLLAAGPAFRVGTSAAPAGIVDVAPTVCHVLGLEAPAAWNGRILEEAFPGGAEPHATMELLVSATGASGRATRATLVKAGNVSYLAELGSSP